MQSSLQKLLCNVHEIQGSKRFHNSAFCHLDLEKNITRMENFTSGHVMYPRHFDHMSEGSQVSWGVIWQVFFSYVNS